MKKLLMLYGIFAAIAVAILLANLVISRLQNTSPATVANMLFVIRSFHGSRFSQFSQVFCCYAIAHGAICWLLPQLF